MRSLFFVLWIFIWTGLTAAGIGNRNRGNGISRKKYNACQRDQTLLVYKVVFTGLWSRENFPKHFPDWRPKAHFSKLVGRSHNEDFKLFRLDDKVSDGVRLFAETGTSDVLNESSQGGGGVFDEFNAPPIPNIGETEAEFFVDGNHSRVSLMVRLVPSPDWFVGLDSVDLCSDGNWVSSLTIEGHPFDAGTDNGLTFTSPNWRTEPYSVVTRLTSKSPSHPASSFFYNDREQHPPIASIQFVKVKEYELSQVFNFPTVQYETFGNNEVYDSKLNIRPLDSNYLKHATVSSYSKNPSLSSNFLEYLTRLEQQDQESINQNNKRKKLKKFRGPRNSHPRRHHRPLFMWTEK